MPNILHFTYACFVLESPGMRRFRMHYSKSQDRWGEIPGSVLDVEKDKDGPVPQAQGFQLGGKAGMQMGSVMF